MSYTPESNDDVPLGAVVRTIVPLVDGDAIVAAPGEFGRVIEKVKGLLPTVKWFSSGRVYDVDFSEVEVMTAHLLDSPEEFQAARNTKGRAR